MARRPWTARNLLILPSRSALRPFRISCGCHVYERQEGAGAGASSIARVCADLSGALETGHGDVHSAVNWTRHR